MREATISTNAIVTGYFQYKSRMGNSNEFTFVKYSTVFSSGKLVINFENALFYLILSFRHEIVVQWKRLLF